MRRYNSGREFEIKVSVKTGARYFCVINTFGSTGINGDPATVFVLSMNYEMTAYHLDYIKQPDGYSVAVSIADETVTLMYKKGETNVRYAKLLVITM